MLSTLLNIFGVVAVVIGYALWLAPVDDDDAIGDVQKGWLASGLVTLGLGFCAAGCGLQHNEDGLLTMGCVFTPAGLFFVIYSAFQAYRRVLGG